MSATPTTWVSRPVCATEAMIEAGITAVREKDMFPYMSIWTARRIVQCAVDAALKASPKPIENDPEVGDRTNG